MQRVKANYQIEGRDVYIEFPDGTPDNVIQENISGQTLGYKTPEPEPWESQDFAEYMKNAENAAEVGKKGDVWMPHKSPEGGRATLGYGLKALSDAEEREWSKGVPHNVMLEMFKDRMRQAGERVKKKVGEDVWSTLDYNRKAMLLDIQYNVQGGLDTFPSFTEAVVNNNKDKMLKEYKRSYKDADGNRHMLERRNILFKNAFLDKL